ncbi:uncharacterized protein LOC126682629 [Mercurialis annua]|uniref:uncharacterized protein LOC126682629 n=1 Tax=Mercurialis annua TaxID=3986 RepID=UPI00215E26D4|nr:uncharacterized protein LOC126682629 [Mercurialis annua]XP_050234333.1 uncharacterized protein LOC126682629 [Mercurialis annua]
MLGCKNSIQQTYYDILSIQENASYEEIRTSYRSAILNYHPDKLQQNTHQTSNPHYELEARFLNVQKAWDILGNERSRRVYDSELRALRNDSGVAEDLGLDDMMMEDSGEVLDLFYQCRCGDYFSIDSLELGKMGFKLLRDEKKISFEATDALSVPASIVLSCGSCSLQIRLLINPNIKVSIDDSL